MVIDMDMVTKEVEVRERVALAVFLVFLEPAVLLVFLGFPALLELEVQEA